MNTPKKLGLWSRLIAWAHRKTTKVENTENFERYAAEHNPALFVLLKMQNMERELDKAQENLEALSLVYGRIADESMQLVQACGATVSEATILAWQHHMQMRELRNTLAYIHKTKKEIGERIAEYKQGTLN